MTDGILVKDIKVGARDFNGNEITAVYGGVSTLYAVYSAAGHIFIQFADDNYEGANQRAALCSLASLRSQVDTRIDRLRTRTFPLLFAGFQKRAEEQTIRKADEHERALARFLLMALQGDVQGASTQLAELRDEINEDRSSEIRSWHVLYAALATLATITICWVFSTNWFNEYIHNFAAYEPKYWNAAGIGAIGAFFSIALQIRGRAVPVDLQTWDNISDAMLRIFIGSTSAVMLHALIIGGVVSLQIGNAPVVIAANEEARLGWQVVLAFTAGFTERLVSDFINGFSLTRKGTNSGAATPVAGSTAKNERDIAATRVASPGAVQTAKQTSNVSPNTLHDPDLPNRIEADELENAEKLIGGKLDPMQELG